LSKDLVAGIPVNKSQFCPTLVRKNIILDLYTYIQTLKPISA
jgi:hypothetical protein